MYDVVVIGGGPAGLAAAVSAEKNGAKTLIIERENKIGGILKQCIHDGFGLLKFHEKLSGPEYAYRYIEMAKNIETLTSTFVTSVKKINDTFHFNLVTKDGLLKVTSKSLILSTGCRERTAKQIFIHGTRPAGVYTAGTAQYFVNIMGYLPGKKTVILGSGDIGLIMARRLTLEGAEVLGVYEAKSTPSGLQRNIAQCLDDFNIPLHLSKTVTKVLGTERVEGVIVSSLDETMKILPNTEEFIECDSLILSVGLIPENEVAESLNITLDPSTKGPYVDDFLMSVDSKGVFSCGNALHVNDLVDYVSESGEIAGKNAANYSKNFEKNSIKEKVSIKKGNNILYVVPQYVSKESKEFILYFRVNKVMKNKTVIIKDTENIIFKKKYLFLKPPEMEKIVLKINNPSQLKLEVI
ncbi:pyridine nucleotide-disulfide oxidoreductase [Tepiditoga spiralis]|uniref:Pyridine nucleotide-disulfide oxidoreductase n=2 Tax=Tepiditoga spiralis TaxID=2108365 RepID=A0A7G1G7R0_9BACT|nr:pyridine nucleotide-disulfide oxidoreductase [Tepiditoga spiralis]